MAVDITMKTLVVDDMAVMRKIIIKSLGKMGFENIDQAEDGAIALGLLEGVKDSEPYQFIVSDWNMPNMTGLELLKQLRAHPIYKKVPFVMVTAEGEKDNVIEAVKAGVSNFVTKPFTPELLQQKIEQVFKK